MNSRFLSAALLALTAVAAPARADEVADNLKNALSSYEAGNFSEALQAVDYASQLIRQKKADSVAALLPNGPSGWTAEEAQAEAAAAMMMGGIVTAKRSYSRGDSNVSIQIQSDSPLLQTYGMMLANPALLAGSGARLETIKGQRVAVTYRQGDKAGDVKAVIDNRYVLTIEGSGVTREELTSFVGLLDLAKLAKLK
jgi:hypothetical protein